MKEPKIQSDSIWVPTFPPIRGTSEGKKQSELDDLKCHSLQESHSQNTFTS